MQARARAWVQGNQGAAATSPPHPPQGGRGRGTVPALGCRFGGWPGQSGTGTGVLLGGRGPDQEPCLWGSACFPCGSGVGSWGPRALAHSSPCRHRDFLCAALGSLRCVSLPARGRVGDTAVPAVRPPGPGTAAGRGDPRSGRGAGSLKGHAAARRQRTRFLQGALLPTPEPQG